LADDQAVHERFLSAARTLDGVSEPELARVREGLAEGQSVGWAAQELLKRCALTPRQVAELLRVGEVEAAESAASGRTRSMRAADSERLERARTGAHRAPTARGRAASDRQPRPGPGPGPGPGGGASAGTPTLELPAGDGGTGPGHRTEELSEEELEEARREASGRPRTGELAEGEGDSSGSGRVASGRRAASSGRGARPARGRAAGGAAFDADAPTLESGRVAREETEDTGPVGRLSKVETRELQRGQREPRLGQTVGGRFRLENELGRGAQGIVYRARDLHLARDVAIKVLRTDAPGQARERFEREAKAISQLRHPGIVTVFEAGGTDAGALYYAMEYVPGKSLEEVLDDEGFLDAPRAVRILETAALAVHHAHDSGLIHRDLKPGNLLLDREGTPKIADFGLVTLAEGTRLTMTRGVVGTPVYMAPEQAEGERVDRRADVYSLGAILYEALTGQPPFAGATPLEIFRKVVQEDPAPLRSLRPEVPPAVERVCLRALEKRPRARYLTAAAFGRDLRRALEGHDLAPAAGRGVVGRRLERVRRSHPAGVGVAAGVVLGLVVGLLAGGRGGPAPAVDPGVAAATPSPVDPARAERRARLLEQARQERARGFPEVAIDFARALGEEELDRDPGAAADVARARALEALARLDLGQPAEAGRAAGAAALLAGDDPLVRTAQAALRTARGDRAAARGELARVCRDAPGLVEAHLERGRAADDPRERAAALDRALELTGERPWPIALQARAAAHLAAGRAAAAAADARTLVARVGSSAAAAFPVEVALAGWAEDPTAARRALAALAGDEGASARARARAGAALAELENRAGRAPAAAPGAVAVGDRYRVHEVRIVQRDVTVETAGSRSTRQESERLEAVYEDRVEAVAPGGRVSRVRRRYEHLRLQAGAAAAPIHSLTLTLERGGATRRLSLPSGHGLEPRLVRHLRREAQLGRWTGPSPLRPPPDAEAGVRWRVPIGELAPRLLLDAGDLDPDQSTARALLARVDERTARVEVAGTYVLTAYRGQPAEPGARGTLTLSLEADAGDPFVGEETTQARYAGAVAYGWADLRLRVEVTIDATRVVRRGGE